jgi:hypothetical protein
MEIWQIVVICILMIPAFLAANYFLVKRMAADRRLRDERIERAVAESVAASFADDSMRFQSWPKYRAKMKRQK